ncbi:M14 family metallopeptidase [Hyphobacterium sp. SN044]|uniref:M14 metallopeptidase family protein n=1 Tax=Hyphobacterium sp. SN044 TaxID=2912575 RepID=UPI001F18BE34|nr:M14 metallopeptidase family protein [Hyphobacterium sp. SN044]MCF8880008.1 M14 family metallopeptidase [Hyphobacterium sp. SN044]
MTRSLLTLLAVLTLPGAALPLTLTAAAGAQDASPFEIRHDSDIPDGVRGLGHEFGAEITPPEDAIDYLRALEAAAPDRIRVFDYAESWEGRTLAYAVIARAEILDNLDAVQADLARLADPRGVSAAELDRLVAETPPVVWLSYGVHGDEISSTDAGLRTAYHLVSGVNDPMVETILDNTIVVIDPVQNPDGRARFVHSFTAARGIEPDPSRFSAEHDQPWPGGRFNHYLFDMNRDWFTMSQPETVGRVQAMLDWHPVVVVDAHEMGGDSTYFFAPAAEPFNPQIVRTQRAAQDLIGRNHARWFDRFGYTYFTREIFDLFYPGYGDMWPTMHGAVAMTYEQASPRGLVWRRQDGSTLTYGEAVDHHFIASLSTAQVVAENRERFVRDRLAFRQGAIDERSGPRAILLDRTGNRWGAERLARLLARQGIEVDGIDGGFTACGSRFRNGAYLVRFDQPAGRLARTLLEADTRLPDAFMAEQESRRARGLDHELYDVTAWSLPLMFDVDMAACSALPTNASQRFDPETEMSGGVVGDAAFGYAIPWTDAGQAAMAAALLRQGVAMRTTDAPFTIGERVFPRGTVVIQRHGQADGLDTLVRDAAENTGAIAIGLSSSWTDEGPNLGSGNFNAMVAPRIAMAWGEGTAPTSAGAVRFVLEQRYDLPVTIIRTERLRSADLSGFDVLILPEAGGAGYSGELGENGAHAITRFVQSGGVLVGLGDATRWMASSGVDLLPVQRERAADAIPDDGAEGPVIPGRIIEDEAQLLAAETPRNAMPDSSPGALLRVTANADAWMSAGYDDGAFALVTGSDIYSTVPLDELTTALRFAGPDDLVGGGYLWAENRAQLAYKPFIVSRSSGRGQVIAFTQDPSTRAYQEGLDLALLNAVLLGPAHASPYR